MLDFKDLFWTKKKPKEQTFSEILLPWVNLVVELFEYLKIFLSEYKNSLALFTIGFLVYLQLYLMRKELNKKMDLLINIIKGLKKTKSDSQISINKISIIKTLKRSKGKRFRQFRQLRTASWIKEVEKFSQNGFNHLDIPNKNALHKSIDEELTQFMAHPIHDLGSLGAEKDKQFFQQFKLSEIALQHAQIEPIMNGKCEVSTKVSWKCKNKALRNVKTKDGKVKKVLRKPGSLLYKHGFEGCKDFGKIIITNKKININHKQSETESQCTEQTSQLNENKEMSQSEQYGQYAQYEQYEEESLSGRSSQISSSNTYSLSLDQSKTPLGEPKMNKCAELRIRHNTELSKNLTLAARRRKGFDTPADSPIYVPKIL